LSWANIFSDQLLCRGGFFVGDRRLRTLSSRDLLLHIHIHRFSLELPSLESSVLGARNKRLAPLPFQVLNFILDFSIPLFIVPDLLRHKLPVPRIEMRHELWYQNGMCNVTR
jgi:hypothetical protein